ncbi:MAG: copper resistance protein CopC, partial [Ilumatobacteraceae bacterium]
MAIIGSLWTSSAAAADNTLTGSNPAADSTVATSPSSMVLTFAAPLGNDNVVVVACGGTAASVGTAQVGADSLTLTVPITAALPKGTCNVTWRVSQTNGSPGGNGTFAFKVAADTATTVATEPAGAASATTVASAAASQGNTAGTTGTE